MSKVFLLLLLLYFSVGQAADQKNRFEGYIFSYKNKDFITAHLGTTFPQFKITWKDINAKKELCISSKIGECPTYTVHFKREFGSKGEIIFAKAEIVSPFDDPEARREFLQNFTHKKRLGKR